jgi:tRNA(Arg) A34 adenosine deaminase TadA
MIHHVLAGLKVQNALGSKTESEIVSAVEHCLLHHETGDAPRLPTEQRSQGNEVGCDGELATRGHKRPRSSGTSMAAEASKRPRHDEDSLSAPSTTALDAEGLSSDKDRQVEWTASGALYKHHADHLKARFCVPEGQFARHRLVKAQQVFATLGKEVLVSPNPRTFVLMLAAASAANDVEVCKHFLNSMLVSSMVTYEGMYMYMQPAFIHKLIEQGVLEDRPELLSAERNSTKWCFLVAAAEAARGNQFGSKHGSVITKDGIFLSKGHNHRFAVPNDPHVRVMHAEVHALVKLPHKADAAGCECYIVELDGAGVGYEEAVPCPMCQSTVCMLGLSKTHFSSHSGIISQEVSFRPLLKCATYDAALQRVYPDPLSNPDDPATAAERAVIE